MKTNKTTDLTAEDVLYHSFEYHYEAIRGVYFLIDGEDIVYVGQSTDIHNRLRTHSMSKKFNRVHWVVAPLRENLDEVEARYIIKFQPKINKKLPFDFGCISEGYLNKTRNGGAVSNAKKLRSLGIEPEFVLHNTRYFKASVLNLFAMRPYYELKVKRGEAVR